jgi:hypothetical protein
MESALGLSLSNKGAAESQAAKGNPSALPSPIAEFLGPFSPGGAAVSQTEHGKWTSGCSHRMPGKLVL